MKRLAITALLVALFSTSSARAETPPCANAAPASYVYGDSLIRSAAADADRWWTTVVGAPAAPMQLFVCDTRDDNGAWGSLDSGIVWFDRDLRNALWDLANDRSQPIQDRRSYLVELWGIVAHERGHNLGFKHAEVGCPNNIMCVGNSKAKPAAALMWAQRVLPTSRSGLRANSRQ